MTTHTVKDATINIHSHMINDKWRNDFYYQALKAYAPGKTVLDVGCGSGILSFYALSLGAKFVYAVDINPDWTAITQNVLSQYFDQSQFKVINKNFIANESIDEIDSPIDVMVTETFGPSLFNQGIFQTWLSTQQYASNDIITIPSDLSIDIQVFKNENFYTKFQFEDNSNIITEENVIDQKFFNAIKQVDSETKTKQPLTQEWIHSGYLKNSIPDEITELFKYSYHNLPDIELTNKPFPQNLKPVITAQVNIDVPSTIVLSNKISSNNKTICLSDSESTLPWQHIPFAYIDEPGTYSITYSDYQDLLGPLGNHWIINKY